MNLRRQPIRNYWFCQSEGQPNLRREKDYNDFFRHQLAEVRQAFQLKPKTFGLDTSNYLKPIVVRDRLAFVTLLAYQWNILVHHGDNSTVLVNTHPHLSLCFHRSDLSPDFLSRQVTDAEFIEVLNLPFILVYPVNYPQRQPDMFINRLLLQSTAFSSFHNMNGQRICTMNGDDDWRPGVNGTMVNSINALTDWMMAHCLSSVNAN